MCTNTEACGLPSARRTVNRRVLTAGVSDASIFPASPCQLRADNDEGRRGRGGPPVPAALTPTRQPSNTFLGHGAGSTPRLLPRLADHLNQRLRRVAITAFDLHDGCIRSPKPKQGRRDGRVGGPASATRSIPPGARELGNSLPLPNRVDVASTQHRHIPNGRRIQRRDGRLRTTPA